MSLRETFKPKVIEDEPKSDKKNGVISFLHQKGYGFIISKEVPFTRIFFHWEELTSDSPSFPDLKKRMKVEFMLKKNAKGYYAIKVKVL